MAFQIDFYQLEMVKKVVIVLPLELLTQFLKNKKFLLLMMVLKIQQTN